MLANAARESGETAQVVRRHDAEPLERSEVVPNERLVRGLEPDAVQPPSDRTESLPHGCVVPPYDVGYRCVEHDEPMLASEPPNQTRLREHCDVGLTSRRDSLVQPDGEVAAEGRVLDANTGLAFELGEHRCETPLLDT